VLHVGNFDGAIVFSGFGVHGGIKCKYGVFTMNWKQLLKALLENGSIKPYVTICRFYVVFKRSENDILLNVSVEHFDTKYTRFPNNLTLK